MILFVSEVGMPWTHRDTLRGVSPDIGPPLLRVWVVKKEADSSWHEDDRPRDLLPQLLRLLPFPSPLL